MNEISEVEKFFSFFFFRSKNFVGQTTRKQNATTQFIFFLSERRIRREKINIKKNLTIDYALKAPIKIRLCDL